MEGCETSPPERASFAASGCAGAGAEAAGTCSPRAPIHAIGWPTGAVSPALTTTPRRTPASNASTSSVAFSVSTCATTSPALTSSPSFLSHSAILPSVI